MTSPPAISTPRTMSSSTTLRRISGSMTATSALRMSASEGTRESYRPSAVDQPGQPPRHGVVAGRGDPRPRTPGRAGGRRWSGSSTAAPASRTISAAAATSTDRDGFSEAHAVQRARRPAGTARAPARRARGCGRRCPSSRAAASATRPALVASRSTTPSRSLGRTPPSVRPFDRRALARASPPTPRRCRSRGRSRSATSTSAARRRTRSRCSRRAGSAWRSASRRSGRPRRATASSPSPNGPLAQLLGHQPERDAAAGQLLQPADDGGLGLLVDRRWCRPRPRRGRPPARGRHGWAAAAARRPRRRRRAWQNSSQSARQSSDSGLSRKPDHELREEVRRLLRHHAPGRRHRLHLLDASGRAAGTPRRPRRSRPAPSHASSPRT